jgi:hypothetical protein
MGWINPGKHAASTLHPKKSHPTTTQESALAAVGALLALAGVAINPPVKVNARANTNVIWRSFFIAFSSLSCWSTCLANCGAGYQF